MKSINFLAVFVLVLSALLILPGFSAIVSLDSFKAQSYIGDTPAVVTGVVVGNRTWSGTGGSDANFTLFFDLSPYIGLTIPNFRIKHAFSIPAGGAGWSATGAWTTNGTKGLVSLGNNYTAQVVTPLCVSAENRTFGDLNTNNTFFNFNCSLPVSQRYLTVTFAADTLAAAGVNDNKGTAAFGNNWGIMEFESSEIAPLLQTYAQEYEVSCPVPLAGMCGTGLALVGYTFAACSNSSTIYNCNRAVTFLNGTVIYTGYPSANVTCTLGNTLVSGNEFVPFDLFGIEHLESGSYYGVTQCDINGSAANGYYLSPSVLFTIGTGTPLTTTSITTAGVTGMAVVSATNAGTLYWSSWIASNGSLLFGLIVAAIVLIVFLTLSGTFNLPILATAGLIIAAFIAFVTFILTNPSGLLLLIIIILAIMITGAFLLFKGMFA